MREHYLSLLSFPYYSALLGLLGGDDPLLLVALDELSHEVHLLPLLGLIEPVDNLVSPGLNLCLEDQVLIVIPNLHARPSATCNRQEGLVGAASPAPSPSLASS